MSYEVLARRLRPKKFAEVIGQEHVTKALQNAVKEEKLHHAYLLTGTRGVGKTTIARILAKAVNCLNVQDGEPCGHCEICQGIDKERFPDLLEIDAASNTGIDHIREVLDNARYMPTMGKYKIYIIDEVHMLSKSAFNAMLKTLEEPPTHAKFILATTDAHKVPVTILSRCLQFILRNLPSQQIVAHLENIMREMHLSYEKEAIQLLARFATGSMRDALSLLDEALALSDNQIDTAIVEAMLGVVKRDTLYQLLLLISQDKRQELYHQLNGLRYKGINFAALLDELIFILNDLAVYKSFSIIPEEYEKSQQSLFYQLERCLSNEQIQVFYQTVVQSKRDETVIPDDYTGFLMMMVRLLSFQPYFLKDESSLPSDVSNIGLKKKSSLNTVSTTLQQESASPSFNNKLEKSTQLATSQLTHPIQQNQDSFDRPQTNLLAPSEEKWLTMIDQLLTLSGEYNQSLIFQTAFISLKQEKKICICAIKKEDYFDLKVVDRYKQSLHDAFAKYHELELIWSIWQSGLRTYAELKLHVRDHQRQQILHYLDHDPQAVELKNLFEGKWDPSTCILV